MTENAASIDLTPTDDGYTNIASVLIISTLADADNSPAACAKMRGIIEALIYLGSTPNAAAHKATLLKRIPEVSR